MQGMSVCLMSFFLFPKKTSSLSFENAQVNGADLTNEQILEPLK